MTGTLLLACCVALAWVVVDSARVALTGRSAAPATPAEQDEYDRWLVEEVARASASRRCVRPGRRTGRRRPARRLTGVRPAGPRPRTARVH